MNCHACGKPTSQSAYSCDECLAHWAEQQAKIDKIALTFNCKSCHATVGEPCRTGSGSERCAHVPREKLAVKVLKQQEAAR